jgi:hypothetical protein
MISFIWDLFIGFSFLTKKLIYLSNNPNIIFRWLVSILFDEDSAKV